MTRHGMLSCAAGCGIPLHPAAAAGGYTTHPGCDPGRGAPGWRCLRCDANGPADTHALAAHLAWAHHTFACPAAPAISRAERVLRMARRRDLTDRYPEQAPPWPPVRADHGGRSCSTPAKC